MLPDLKTYLTIISIGEWMPFHAESYDFGCWIFNKSQFQKGWWDNFGIPQDVLFNHQGTIKIFRTIGKNLFRWGNKLDWVENAFMWMLLIDKIKPKVQGVPDNPQKPNPSLNWLNLNVAETKQLAILITDVTNVLVNANRLDTDAVFAVQGIIMDSLRASREGRKIYPNSPSLEDLDKISAKIKVLNHWEVDFNFHSFRRTPPPFDAMIWDSWESFFLCKTVYEARVSPERLKAAKWDTLQTDDFKQIAAQLIKTCPNYCFETRRGFSHPDTASAVRVLETLLMQK